MSTASIDSFNPTISFSDEVQTHVLSAFAGIIWYNAIELVILCFVTFKRYRGCYFWSLLLSSASLIPHTMGYLFYLYPLGISHYAAVTLILFPWCVMVTGQSLVLWSRLHLVLQCHKILRGVLIMIIVDAIIFHTPVFVLMYGMISSRTSSFDRGYDIMERVQLVGFCVQELVLSGLYVWETAKMLRLRPAKKHRQILIQLLVINVFILILDLAVVATEYAGYYAVQVMFKPVAYSVKLKLEYAILGKLVEIVRGGDRSSDPPSCARETLHGDETPISIVNVNSASSSSPLYH